MKIISYDQKYTAAKGDIVNYRNHRFWNGEVEEGFDAVVTYGSDSDLMAEKYTDYYKAVHEKKIEIIRSKYRPKAPKPEAAPAAPVVEAAPAPAPQPAPAPAAAAPEAKVASTTGSKKSDK